VLTDDVIRLWAQRTRQRSGDIHWAVSVDVQRPERTAAVCVIRIERQSSGPLITIRINYNIAGVSTDAVQTESDVGSALVAVREFLEHASGEQLARS
jgi:hypothetical protein